MKPPVFRSLHSSVFKPAIYGYKIMSWLKKWYQIRKGYSENYIPGKML